MTNPHIPSDEELNAQYVAEVSRAMNALSLPLLQALDNAQVGADMPRRVSAAVVIHALILMGLQVGAQRGLALEDMNDIYESCTSFLTGPNSPVAVRRRS